MKRLFFVVPVLLTVLMYVPSTAHAKPAKPQSTDCITNSCWSSGYWNGNNDGGFVEIYADAPGLADTNAYWNRFLRISGNGSVDYPRVEVGITKFNGTGYGNYCSGMGQGGTREYFFIYTWDVFHDNLYNSCVLMTSAQQNQDYYLQVDSWGFQCKNGVEIDVFDNSYNKMQTACLDWATYSLLATYTRETDVEAIADHVTGHRVWGHHWTDNEWVNDQDTFNYQARNYDVRSWRDNFPPQFFWNVVPAPGNHGGELYSCDYESGNTCMYGS